MSGTSNGKKPDVPASVPMLNWEISSEGSTDEECNANARNTISEGGNRIVNLDNDSDVTSYSSQDENEDKECCIIYETVSNFETQDDGKVLQNEGDTRNEKNAGHIKSNDNVSCEEKEAIEGLQEPGCLKSKVQSLVTGDENNIDLQIDKLKDLNIGEYNVQLENNANLELSDEMLNVTSESNVWNYDIIQALQDDESSCMNDSAQNTSKGGVKLKLVRSKSDESTEEWMSMIISECESESGNVFSLQGEELSKIESGGSMKSAKIYEVESEPSGKRINISEISSKSSNTLPIQTETDMISSNPTNKRGLMNAVDSDICRATTSSGIQTHSKRKLRNAQQRGHKLFERKKRRCTAHRRFSGVRFSNRISEYYVESYDTCWANNYQQQNRKNQKVQLRKRLMEIREEVYSCVTGDGDEISKGQAHRLMNEVQLISRNLLDILHLGKSKQTQKRDINEVTQVCDTLRKQLQGIIDFDWEMFLKNQGNVGSVNSGSSSSEVYDSNDEDMKSEIYSCSHSASCSRSNITVVPTASTTSNLEVFPQCSDPNHPLLKPNSSSFPPALQPTKTKHVCFSTEKTPMKRSPKKMDNNCTMSPILRKSSISKKVTSSRAQKSMTFSRSKTITGKKLATNESEVTTNNSNRITEQRILKLSPKKYDIFAVSSPQIQTVNDPNQIFSSPLLSEGNKGKDNYRSPALSSKVLVPITASSEQISAHEITLNITESCGINENDNTPLTMVELNEEKMAFESQEQSSSLVSQSLLSYQQNNKGKILIENLGNSQTKINSTSATDLPSGGRILHLSSSSPQLDTEYIEDYNALLQKYKSQGAIPKRLILESQTQTDYAESEVTKSSEKSDIGTQTSQQENKTCNDQVSCLTEDMIMSYPELPGIPLTRAGVPLSDRIYYMKYLRLPEECEYISNIPDIDEFWRDINAPWPGDWLKDLEDW